MNPAEIVQSFFKQDVSIPNFKDQKELLFRFIQYCERQIVLFDALEDAAFPMTHNLKGQGTIDNLIFESKRHNKKTKVAEKLTEFAIRPVLTAHPTQFYPSEVLGIIHDLAKALSINNTLLVNSYLEQLGKTAFFKKKKPSPYEEAVNLIWFLENIFYYSAGNILTTLYNYLPHLYDNQNSPIRIGFWPGGDRDGNPLVNAKTTLRVGAELKNRIISNYLKDILVLKRRLTFTGVSELLIPIEKNLKAKLTKRQTNNNRFGKDEFINQLTKVKTIIVNQHNSLFVEMVDSLICKVKIFGFFFASIDIRQISTIHTQIINEFSQLGILPDNYPTLDEESKIKCLLQLNKMVPSELMASNPVWSDTLESILAVQKIQKENGKEGCHRYIISHTTSALNVIEVFALFKICNATAQYRTEFDIVPLFETINDLKNAGLIMKQLFCNTQYREHLRVRKNTQSIMLGFSDSTKDGGYLMANWSILKAKKDLTVLAKEYGIRVIFFDGRGGPPGRGGGKTHQFYSSLGKDIANEEIHLTIQGQTISSNFGTVASSQFNMEQLIHAGVGGTVLGSPERTLSTREEELLSELASLSYNSYVELKTHHYFIDYLTDITPLNYYSRTNIASRPFKRGNGKLSLETLRAVPYVGAWSQVKQNIPGYYGVGSAFQALDEQGKYSEIEVLYKTSLFFKTLLDNCAMSMKKCFFPLTSQLKNHPHYGPVWNLLHNEYLLTKKYILKITGSSELMSDRPIGKISVEMRHRIELPLLTIQQFALSNLREKNNSPSAKVFEKLVVRCSIGIINAERNSA